MFYDVRKTHPYKRACKFPFIYKVTLIIQRSLHWMGIAVHNPFSDECTPDFNCCCEVGRKAFIRITFKREVAPPKD